MNKIAVIGCSGSGKSTLSRKLGEAYRLSVYHLDSFFWKPGWVMTPPEEWDRLTEQLVGEEKWIIDGNYSRTLAVRLAAADAIIFFDLPRYVCLYRIIKRRFMFRNKSRPDMAEGCMEKLDWPFLKFVWNFRKNNRPKIIRLLAEYGKQKNVITLRSTGDVTEFIKNVSIEAVRERKA